MRLARRRLEGMACDLIIASIRRLNACLGSVPRFIHFVMPVGGRSRRDFPRCSPSLKSMMASSASRQGL